MQSFAFVTNVASLAAESFTLAPRHVLRGALPEEIAFIKGTVQGFGGTLHPYRNLLWEGEWPVTIGRRIEELPESEWRYFVIAFEGNNATLIDLQLASDLAAAELEIGFTAIVNPACPGGVVVHPDCFFQALAECEQVLHDPDSDYFVKVSRDIARRIAEIYSRLSSEDQSLIDVKSLARRVGDLKSLPRHSALKFLGYFAILESLLTHPPRPSDPYDAITRQVKTKVALLDNRFDQRIDYSDFGGALAETVWTKMYTYRSSVAHGSTPSFTGDLSILGNHQRAMALVKGTVKAVIRQALIEPQLILDLRNC